jgi:hypothetical protein
MLRNALSVSGNVRVPYQNFIPPQSDRVWLNETADMALACGTPMHLPLQRFLALKPLPLSIAPFFVPLPAALVLEGLGLELLKFF